MAVGVIHKAAVGIGELELRPGNQIPGHAVLFLDDQSAGLFIPKRQLLDFSGLNQNVLGSAVKHISLHGLDFAGDDGGAGFDAVQHDLARLVRIVGSIVRANSGPGAVHHLKAHAGQRFIFRALNKLADNQSGGRLVVKNQAVGNAGADNDIFGGFVLNIASGGLALGHHDGGVGGQPGDGHGAVRPGDIPAIVGADGPALTVPNKELRPGQRLLGYSVPFEDGQGAEGVVVKAEGLRIPGVDHNGLRGGVGLIIRRSLYL